MKNKYTIKNNNTIADKQGIIELSLIGRERSLVDSKQSDVPRRKPLAKDISLPKLRALQVAQTTEATMTWTLPVSRPEL